MSTYDLVVRCKLWTQNANDRMNHWRRSERISEMRGAAKIEARQARLPFGIRRARIIVTPLQSTRGPAADPGAYWPPVKAAIDGLRDARCLIEDTDVYVSAIELRASARVPTREQGLRLTIIEDDEQHV